MKALGMFQLKFNVKKRALKKAQFIFIQISGPA